MKHLMTLMVLVVAVTAGAQGTTIHEYPWNPDFNNDTYIGSEDLMGLLSTYGTQFGNPPEPCDYDGTPLEEFATGIIVGDVILDSIFVEFELQDVTTYYPAGCPDEVTDTLVFASATMLRHFNLTPSSWSAVDWDIYGSEFSFRFFYVPTSGNYYWSAVCWSLHQLGFTSDGFFGSAFSSSGTQHPIPFTEDWYLDEEGIHIESGWDENDWPYYANYFHILPYWHYAE